MSSAAALADRMRAKPAGAGWLARCPAHEDQRESLSIGTGEGGRTLLKCHAGCQTESVLSAIGLTFADLNDSPTPGKSEIAATYLPAKGDVCDFLETRSKADLLALVKSSDEYAAEAAAGSDVEHVTESEPYEFAAAFPQDHFVTAYVGVGTRAADSQEQSCRHAAGMLSKGWTFTGLADEARRRNAAEARIPAVVTSAAESREPQTERQRR